MMKRTFFCHLCSITIMMVLTCATPAIQPQNVGVNDDSSTPNSNAILHVQSSSKGFLTPRLTPPQCITLSLRTSNEGVYIGTDGNVGIDTAVHQ